ncbi:MAG: RdgB/HAM1 family non-canonical purine NTP pyrophosphatase [Gallionella sp.]
MKKLVIASNNAGKLAEFKVLLAPLGIEVVTQAQLGIKEAEEPHSTFIENALAKARHVSRESGLPALADDSGICVDALNGLPGVLSARFSGLPSNDQRNNVALLEAMKTHSNRRAHYACVLVLMRSAADAQPLIAEGEWHGEIAREPRGTGGFGYDPLFWLPQLNMMSSELSREQKDEIGHRGKAMKVLLQKLQTA